MREHNAQQAVGLRALFTAFLIVSLCAAGGGSGIVLARRIAVENRRWLSDGEFAERVLRKDRQEDSSKSGVVVRFAQMVMEPQRQIDHLRAI